MGTPVRAAVGGLRALGPRAGLFADLLSCESKGFISANEGISESFPLVVRRGGAMGYGLCCGSRPARAGEEVLRVPPGLWLPYCAEAAVRKAEAGAPDVLARLSNACASVGGGADGSKLAPVACLALELLFSLERNGAKEPYLGLLWEASRSTGVLPHPLLMGPEHLELLQASPLRDSIMAASGIYGNIHRSLFGLKEDEDSGSPERENDHRKRAPSASSTRDFLWAMGVILSRGVSEDAAGGTGLVPYLDFANHGDGPARLDGGGWNSRASCERGFDASTGNHVLRALRDIEPGEELLIDYGSAAKGIYRFARTYGFLTYAKATATNTKSANGHDFDVNSVVKDGNNNGNESRNDLRNEERGQLAAGINNPPSPGSESCPYSGSALAKDSFRVRVGSSTPQTPQQQQQQPQPVVVPVLLADATGAQGRTCAQADTGHGAGENAASAGKSVTGAPDTMAAVPAGARVASDETAAPSGAGAGAVAAEVIALEERLRRYPTSVEEDLELLLRKADDGPVEVEGAQESAAAAAAGGAVTAGWEGMCISVRVAEKLALKRALR
ncbi:unnamed protein product, partial [Hapterophycus canaliculatus]